MAPSPPSGKFAPRRHPLLSLRSVGPATLQDLLLLDVDSPAKLAASDPQFLYEELCRRTGQRVDICQYDVFCCAVAQARDPNLPDEYKDWTWWSRRRKATEPSPTPLRRTAETPVPQQADITAKKSEYR